MTSTAQVSPQDILAAAQELVDRIEATADYDVDDLGHRQITDRIKAAAALRDIAEAALIDGVAFAAPARELRRKSIADAAGRSRAWLYKNTPITEATN